jgi:hypothetical protein
MRWSRGQPCTRTDSLTAVEQPERDPHAYVDGVTGHETIHRQVPMFYYTCDEEIAGLISIMNYCGIHTVNSCQDNRYNRGNVPRVWVEISAECLPPFLAMLDRQDEAGDIGSLSNRMVPAHYPDDPYGREDFEDNRAWHYRPIVQRVNGQLASPTMSIRFPATDLPELVARLHTAAMEMDGRVVTQAADDPPSPETSGPDDGSEP